MNALVRLAACLMAFTIPAAIAADPWPSRTITLVAPGAAGGTSDIFSRLLAEGLAKELGQAVIVENRSGAGTLIASHAVARAKPDGYTLLVGAAALTISPHMYQAPVVDAMRDLQPVRLIARFPNLVVVNASSKVMTIGDLLQLLRSNPGKFNFASGGVGISEHLAGELFQSMTGTELVHIPYKSSADSVSAVVTGDALVSFGNMAVALPQVRAGKLRALAVTGVARSDSLPAIPTMAEAGVAGYDATTWFGLFAPAGTPPAIIARLDEASRRYLASPAAQERLRSLAAEPVDMGPAAFAELVQRDNAKWGTLVRKANLRAE